MTPFFTLLLVLSLAPLYGMYRTCAAIHDWFQNHPWLEKRLEYLHVGDVHLGGMLIAVVIAGFSVVTIFSPYLAANAFPTMVKVGYILDVVYTCVTIWIVANKFGKKTTPNSSSK